jgi:hypothetical protein
MLYASETAARAVVADNPARFDAGKIAEGMPIRYLGSISVRSSR